MTDLTQKYLKSILHYCPNDGTFTRLKTGEIAGYSLSNGYVQIKIKGDTHYAHRLAFLYMTGTWPINQVDHKDQDPSNNSWHNLRECNLLQNNANKSKYKNNKSGFKGVWWDKNTKK